MTQLEPDVVPPDPEVSPKPRRRAGNIVVTVLTVVVLAGAALALVIGVQARSSADDARDRTVALQRDRRASKTREHAVEHTMDTINTAVAKVPTTFDTLAQSLDTVIAAQNNVVDVHNRGVSIYNTGNDRAAVAVYTGDGAAAVADFDAKAAAAKTALANAVTAAHDLEEALHG